MIGFMIMPIVVYIPAGIYLYHFFKRFLSLFPLREKKKLVSVFSVLFAVFCAVAGWRVYGFGAVIVLHFLLGSILMEGFISGANANGQYLDSLKEFPAYFREAGVSADGFVAIMSQTSKMGVTSNKALDTIKEGNIRIREMSTATAEALDNLGLNSKKIQQELAAGTTTTFEVMQKVSTKLSEIPESSQVAGEAITNIFGGPGEDAGYRYLTTLKDISTNLDEVKERSGEMGRLQQEQLESQVELDNAISALFDATGGTFESMTTKAKTFVNKGITAIIKGVVDVCNWFIELYNKSLVIRVGVASIGLQFKTLWSVVKNVLGLIVDEIVGLANMIKGAFTLN